MRNLFLSEWERFWNRKSLWICFIAVPFILYLAARHYVKLNVNLAVTSSNFVSFGNFPSVAIQSQFAFIFNLLVIFICALSITEEYRNGELRMVMIRPVKFHEIFIAKFLVLIAILLLYVTAYFVCSVIIGYFIFPKLNNVAILGYENTFKIGQCFIYGIKHYLIFYITLIALSSVIFFVSIISKSVIITLGISVTFILGSMTYPAVLQILMMDGGVKLLKLQCLSITHIQFNGISYILGQNHFLLGFISIVLATYFLVFSALSYLLISKKDQLI